MTIKNQLVSDVCYDCICVPVCMSKMTNKLVHDCTVIKKVYDDALLMIYTEGDVTVSFKGIKRKLLMRRDFAGALVVHTHTATLYHSQVIPPGEEI